MRRLCLIGGCGAMLGVFLVCGCIPSDPKESPTEPSSAAAFPEFPATAAVSPQRIEPAQEVGLVDPARSAPDSPQPTMHVDMDKAIAINAGVQVMRMKQGLGYTVRGSFGLTGTITKAAPEAPEWTLAAEFAFETGGCTVGAPVVANIQDMVIGAQSVSLQPGSADVVISIPLNLSAKDTTPSEGVCKVPVSAKILAGNDARFTVLLSSG